MLIQTSYLLRLCEIAQRFPPVSTVECRAERARLKLDRKSLLKIARGKAYFPLYKNGRMVVQHPTYDRES